MYYFAMLTRNFVNKHKKLLQFTDHLGPLTQINKRAKFGR